MNEPPIKNEQQAKHEMQGRNDPAGLRADAAGMAETHRTLYEAHVELCQHYSSLVFQGRIATVTLTIIAVAIALGLVPGGGSAPSGMGRGLLAYAAAWLVSLLYAVEVGYVKRFFQVVAAGRQIERELGVAYYFTKYDQPEGVPLRMIYILAVVALLAASALELWGKISLFDMLGRVLAILLPAILPFIPLVASVRRARAVYAQYLDVGRAA
jgi:hypothetical protein